MSKYYKVLNEDGTSTYQNTPWNLPTPTAPGEWMKPITTSLVLCENGYHLCRAEDILTWLNARIFEVEYEGEMISSLDKVVVSQVRLLKELNWNVSIARQFACDCAEYVLPNYEKVYPGDTRVRDCIATMRRFGDIDSATYSSASSAAYSASYLATSSAAYSAASAAYSAASSSYLSAYSAVNFAAYSAASSASYWAASSAAYSDIRQWQTGRLMEYLNA